MPKPDLTITTEATSQSAWWRSAAIYQVYPRSFADANGDGLGDLCGIKQRLPHLAALGVDAVWISPFYRSPMCDGGYDVADYRDIDPIFGNLDDYDAMQEEAHRLGLRVIVDLVPNHTSSAHPWFAQALEAEPGSASRDRYIFRPGKGPDGQLPPNDWLSLFGGPAWTRVADGQWYLHLFDSGQPDLNWENPEVRTEFESILRFWLDRGVDGFRIDVAHGMVKAAGLPDVGLPNQAEIVNQGGMPYFDQPGVHEIYRSWRKILNSYPGERIGVAEAWTGSPARTARYVVPDELHQAFNFDYLQTPWSAGELREVITSSLAESAKVGAPTTWVLSNHDVQRHATRFGPQNATPDQNLTDQDQTDQNATPSQNAPAGDGLTRARAAALLMFALPGSCYVYQGEELGLPEVLDLPAETRQDPQWFRSEGRELGRDGCRVPIPWSGQRQPFGFSPAETTEPWLPQPAEWAELTVERQSDDPASMLSLYREALRLRHSHPALGPNGLAELRWIPAPEGVLAFVRPTGSGSSAGPDLLCAVNLTGETVTLPALGELLLASGQITSSGQAGCWDLPADTTGWWSLRA